MTIKLWKVLKVKIYKNNQISHRLTTFWLKWESLNRQTMVNTSHRFLTGQFFFWLSRNESDFKGMGKKKKKIYFWCRYLLEKRT